MTTTLETIALLLALSATVVLTTESTTIDTDTSIELCSDPGGGTYPPPPQN